MCSEGSPRMFLHPHEVPCEFAGLFSGSGPKGLSLRSALRELRGCRAWSFPLPSFLQPPSCEEGLGSCPVEPRSFAPALTHLGCQSFCRKARATGGRRDLKVKDSGRWCHSPPEACSPGQNKVTEPRRGRRCHVGFLSGSTGCIGSC